MHPLINNCEATASPISLIPVELSTQYHLKKQTCQTLKVNKLSYKIETGISLARGLSPREVSAFGKASSFTRLSFVLFFKEKNIQVFLLSAIWNTRKARPTFKWRFVSRLTDRSNSALVKYEDNEENVILFDWNTFYKQNNIGEQVL